jgi:hypothetical protein
MAKRKRKRAKHRKSNPARKRKAHARKKHRRANPKRRSHRRVHHRRARRSNPKHRKVHHRRTRSNPRRKHGRRRKHHRRNPGGPRLHFVGAALLALFVAALGAAVPRLVSSDATTQKYAQIGAGVAGAVAGVALAPKRPFLAAAIGIPSLALAAAPALQEYVFGPLMAKLQPAPSGAAGLTRQMGAVYSQDLAGLQRQMGAVYSQNMGAVYSQDLAGLIPTSTHIGNPYGDDDPDDEEDFGHQSEGYRTPLSALLRQM